jgi:hypothetical protein
MELQGLTVEVEGRETPLNVIAYLLAQVDWQVWVSSLTFANRPMKDKRKPAAAEHAAACSCRDCCQFHNIVRGRRAQDKLAWAWLQRVARSYRVPDRYLLVALRGEDGELNGKSHFHALIGGLGDGVNWRRASASLRGSWLHFDCGMATTEPYNPAKDGIGYMLDTWGEEQRLAGARGYELAKFGRLDPRLYVSASVFDWLRIRRGLPAGEAAPIGSLV